MKIQIEKPNVVVFESALFKTTTTLLLGTDYLILVDPNWLPSEIEFITSYIENLNIGRKPYLYFTHSDYDHIIGYGAFKHFETIASQNFIDSATKEKTLKQIISFDDSYYITRNFKIEYPEITHSIKVDFQKMIIGNSEFIFWQAVGHNPDGLLLLDVENRILIVGDYMSNVEFPYIYTSIKEYKLTLDKIESILSEYNIQTLISGHGDYTNEKTEMHKRLNDSRRYIYKLEESVLQGKDFDFDQMMEQYEFPIIMRKFHQGNLDLAESEKAIL